MFPILHFYTPWKHKKTISFSRVFKGYRNVTLGANVTLGLCTGVYPLGDTKISISILSITEKLTSGRWHHVRRWRIFRISGRSNWTVTLFIWLQPSHYFRWVVEAHYYDDKENWILQLFLYFWISSTLVFRFKVIVEIQPKISIQSKAMHLDEMKAE